MLKTGSKLRFSQQRQAVAGVTAFLTSAYLLFLIPSMLADAGAALAEATTSVALVAAFATVAMGLIANRPLLVAPGIGTTVYLVYIVVLGGGLSFQAALAATLCAGLLFLLLAVLGLHRFLYEAIPASIRLAFVVGIGLFLTIVGLGQADLLLYQPGSLPVWGDLSSAAARLSSMGTLFIFGLSVLGVRLSLLLGLGYTLTLAWQLKLFTLPEQLISLPVWPSSLLLTMDFTGVFSRPFLIAVIGLFFLLILDITGVLVALERLADKKDGFASRASYSTVAGATVLGTLFGVSPSVVLLESAVGLQTGGRSGISAIVAGILFALALFFTPLFAAVPAAATAPLIIMVGLMMARNLSDLPWQDGYSLVPALITISMMVLSLNIAHGLALGMLSYVLCMVLVRRSQALPLSTYLLTLALALYLLLYI